MLKEKEFTLVTHCQSKATEDTVKACKKNYKGIELGMFMADGQHSTVCGTSREVGGEVERRNAERPKTKHQGRRNLPQRNPGGGSALKGPRGNFA